MPARRSKPRPPYPTNRGRKQAKDDLRKTLPAPDRKKSAPTRRSTPKRRVMRRRK